MSKHPLTVDVKDPPALLLSHDTSLDAELLEVDSLSMYNEFRDLVHRKSDSVQPFGADKVCTLSASVWRCGDLATLFR